MIAPGTFTLNVAGVGGASVPGTVTYDVNSDIATFTPNANLTATTSYTATVSTTATDVSGNPLGAGLIPNPWTFETGSTTEQLPPNLGTAATFAAFGGGAGVTNQGINTVINGDLGTTGASTLVTGFHDAGVGCTYTETGSDVGLVNGNIDTAPPPPTGACLEEGTATTFNIATLAASDANTAFLDLNPASRPGGTDPGAGQLANSTLPPGVYKAAGGTFLITGGDSLSTRKATPMPSGYSRPPPRSPSAMRAFRATCCSSTARRPKTCSGKWAAPPPSTRPAAAPWSAPSSRPWASPSPPRATPQSARSMAAPSRSTRPSPW